MVPDPFSKSKNKENSYVTNRRVRLSSSRPWHVLSKTKNKQENMLFELHSKRLLQVKQITSACSGALQRTNTVLP